MPTATKRTTPRKRPSVAEAWATLTRLPGGKRMFSRMLGRLAPYTATIDCRVHELAAGHAVVAMPDKRGLRNHLECVHAIALMNLGEVATGLAMMFSIDGHGRGIVTHLEMDYVKKARGPITATCDTTPPTTPGRHDCEAEAVLRDADGGIVALARARWRIELDG